MRKKITFNKIRLTNRVSTLVASVVLAILAQPSISARSYSLTKDNLLNGVNSWTLRCNWNASSCEKKYPNFFLFVNRQLTESVGFFGNLGFSHPEFRKASPNVLIYAGCHNGGNDCDGEVASYVNDRKNPKWQGAIFLYNFENYNMFDNEVGPSKPPRPRNEKDEEDLTFSLSHEAFHGFQRLKAHAGNSSKTVDWINEATAEASGYAFTKREFPGVSIRKGFYDLPLHDDAPGSENKGYSRGYFMYQIGKKLNPSSPISWMTKLYSAPANTGRFGNDWISDALEKTKLKNLSEAYIRFIAEDANTRGFYKNENPPKLEVLRRDSGKADKRTVLIDRMAAEPSYVQYKKSVFEPVSDALPGEYAALLEVEVKPKTSEHKPVLVVGKKVAKQEERRKHTILAALDGKQKDWFVRAVNAPKKEDAFEKQEVDLSSQAKTVRFSISSCIEPGKSRPIIFDPVKPDVDLKMSAKRGKIDPTTLHYTAPGAPGDDELEIELNVGKEKTKKFVFAKVKVAKGGCHFRWITPEGYVYSFDTSAEITEARQGSDTALFDREFVYVNDSEMGWIKMRQSQLLSMMKMMPKGKGGLPGLGQIGAIIEKLEVKAGADPLKWGRAPYDFFDKFERSKLRKFAKKRTKSKSAVKGGKREKLPIEDLGRMPCPTTPGTCTVYRINGRDAVYYDSRDRIVAMSVQGRMSKIEYGYYPQSLPKNARLISF